MVSHDFGERLADIFSNRPKCPYTIENLHLFCLLEKAFREPILKVDVTR